MRSIFSFIYFVCFLSIPHLTQAQYDFERGSFVLKENPQVRKYGNIRAGSNNLVLQVENNKTVKYPWEEVLSYRLGLYQYIRASGFPVKSNSGFSEQIAENKFVVLLDSGAVLLMRYEYLASGIDGSSLPAAMYLLQRASETQATPVPASFVDGAGKEFRATIAPFVQTRPDLLKALKDKIVNINNLQTLIHAFNYNEGFLNYPMQGLQSNK